MSAALPTGFVMLEPFAAHWAGENTPARAHLRDTASPADARAFYDAIQPVAEAALDYLDSRPLAEHDVADRRLMHMLLSFAHVAMAVEVQRGEEAHHTRLRRHMHILRTPADA